MYIVFIIKYVTITSINSNSLGLEWYGWANWNIVLNRFVLKHVVYSYFQFCVQLQDYNNLITKLLTCI